MRQKESIIKVYELNKSIISLFEQENHPWILLAWSTESAKDLQQLKKQWLSAINKTGMKVYGLQTKNESMYYYPYPRRHAFKERYYKEIVKQIKG
ncbi:hypothetical protein [Peribacillus sp. SCS-37]|uniref:hypothetical protein n=1 Tax=Paraperibacillus esterisolvens TaxID=3115296 RepID=UPI00390681C0